MAAVRRAAVRQDRRGIVDAEQLMTRVSFRRVAPAEALRDYVEHYWLIDWELTEPFEQHVVPHPSVNIVFQRYGAEPEEAEVAGVGMRLFSIKLHGTGRVSGVQFRPGGFRPFLKRAVSTLTDQRIPLHKVFPALPSPPEMSGDDQERAAKLDAFLLSLDPQPDPGAEQAIRLADQIRTDRGIRRVEDFALQQSMSIRSLQRLFAEYVGVSPKWTILRYRIQEAIELASPEVDWASLAAELGYSDQAHLVRDFTATIGVSPAVYALKSA